MLLSVRPYTTEYVLESAVLEVSVKKHFNDRFFTSVSGSVEGHASLDDELDAFLHDVRMKLGFSVTADAGMTVDDVSLEASVAIKSVGESYSFSLIGNGRALYTLVLSPQL